MSGIVEDGAPKNQRVTRGTAAPKPPPILAETQHAAQTEDEELERAAQQADQRRRTQAIGSQTDEDESDDSPAAPLTRRSRRHGGGAISLDIPEKYLRPGWDYEWKTTVVTGAPSDSSEVAAYYEQSWRPVLASSMPDMVPPGYAKKHVERMGQILMTRPLHLSLEAKQEDYEIAETLKHDKLQAASAVPTSRPGLINPFKTEMKIELVAGAESPEAVKERHKTVAGR